MVLILVLDVKGAFPNAVTERLLHNLKYIEITDEEGSVEVVEVGGPGSSSSRELIRQVRPAKVCFFSF
jgi:hypothetical protein